MKKSRISLKKSYQEYINKQKLERVIRDQNDQGDLLGQSSRSARDMGMKNTEAKSSSDNIKLNRMERFYYTNKI